MRKLRAEPAIRALLTGTWPVHLTVDAVAEVVRLESGPPVQSGASLNESAPKVNEPDCGRGVWHDVNGNLDGVVWRWTHPSPYVLLNSASSVLEPAIEPEVPDPLYLSPLQHLIGLLVDVDTRSVRVNPDHVEHQGARWCPVRLTDPYILWRRSGCPSVALSNGACWSTPHVKYTPPATSVSCARLAYLNLT